MDAPTPEKINNITDDTSTNKRVTIVIIAMGVVFFGIIIYALLFQTSPKPKENKPVLDASLLSNEEPKLDLKINKEEPKLDSKIDEVEDDSLVGLWKFDNHSGLIAPDSNPNNLIISPGLILDGNDCIKDGCLSVDRGVNFYLPDLPQYSFSGWIKQTETPASERQIFNSYFDQAGVTVDYDQRLLFYDGGILKSQTILQKDTFYFIAVTNDGTVKTIYINGQVEATGATTLSIRSGPATFGVNVTANDRYFKGVIDDFRIYNKALTAHEVQQLLVKNSTRAEIE